LGCLGTLPPFPLEARNSPRPSSYRFFTFLSKSPNSPLILKQIHFPGPSFRLPVFEHKEFGVFSDFHYSLLPTLPPLHRVSYLCFLFFLYFLLIMLFPYLMTFRRFGFHLFFFFFFFFVFYYFLRALIYYFPTPLSFRQKLVGGKLS